MNSPIVLLTDFGTADWYVGTMKGVIRSFAVSADIIDLSHDVSNQNVTEASFVLWNAWKFFPEGTVFISVVDPGVGSERDVVVYKTEGKTFVAPNNGLLDYIMNETDGECFVVNTNVLASMVGWSRSNTFHGRDVFAPLGALLHTGKLSQGVLSRVDKMASKSHFIEYNGEPELPSICLYIDKFYNIITNVKLSESYVNSVQLKNQSIKFVKSYFEVEKHELCALRGSSGLLEISENHGAAAKALHISVGDEILLQFKHL